LPYESLWDLDRFSTNNTTALALNAVIQHKCGLDSKFVIVIAANFSISSWQIKTFIQPFIMLLETVFQKRRLSSVTPSLQSSISGVARTSSWLKLFWNLFSFRIFSFLDYKSLCRCSQVSNVKKRICFILLMYINRLL
jgi:hypothetical protein